MIRSAKYQRQWTDIARAKKFSVDLDEVTKHVSSLGIRFDQEASEAKYRYDLRRYFEFNHVERATRRAIRKALREAGVALKGTP